MRETDFKVDYSIFREDFFCQKKSGKLFFCFFTFRYDNEQFEWMWMLPADWWCYHYFMLIYLAWSSGSIINQQATFTFIQTVHCHTWKWKSKKIISDFFCQKKWEIIFFGFFTFRYDNEQFEWMWMLPADWWCYHYFMLIYLEGVARPVACHALFPKRTKHKN